jgi:N6-adenosine-specific RNA methylase IME4
MTPFEIILADPGWKYRDSANAGKRGAVHKYPTMSLPEICALDVRNIAAPNCFVALWWVAPMPAEVLGGRQSLGLYAQDDEARQVAGWATGRAASPRSLSKRLLAVSQ